MGGYLWWSGLVLLLPIQSFHMFFLAGACRACSGFPNKLKPRPVVTSTQQLVVALEHKLCSPLPLYTQPRNKAFT